MTKKHIVVIAATIRDHISRPEKDEAEIYALETLARSLASDFAAFNINFDRSRFLAACGIEPGRGL